MGGRAGRKGLTTDAWIVYFKLDNIEDAGQKLKTLQGENATFYSTRELPKQKHWITNFNQPRKIYNISIDQRDVLENNFFPMTKLMYEHAATLGPIILTETIRATRGTTNRHIRVILSLLPVTPFNYPFSQKEGWIYDLPNEVKKIYKDNDLEEPIPNYTLYMWLTNQIEEIGTEDLEKIVENAKKWSYLFFLLKNNGNDFFMFKENGKDVSEENLYKQIQELLTSCLIRTSTNF